MSPKQELIHSVELLPPDIDLMVVLGKQIGVRSTMDDIEYRSPDHLSVASRMNVLAAGILWKPGMHILLSGNKKALFPQAAVDFLHTHFPDIPDGVILPPDENSLDTQASVKNLPKIVEAGGFTNTALVTVGYHTQRAASQFKRSGVQFEAVVAAEDIVRNPGTYSEFVTAYEGLGWIIKAERAKEAGLRSLGPAIKIGRLVTGLSRP